MDRQNVIAGPLDIAFVQIGPPGGQIAILLHGFPYDAHACVAAGERLAAEGWRVLIPWLRGCGPTRFLSGTTPRSGEQAALGADLLAFMNALDIETAVLAGYDWGGRAACVVAALHPTRVAGLVSIGGYNIMSRAALAVPLPPQWEKRLWYLYYFHSERGRAGLDCHRRDLIRLLWSDWSPAWLFDEATFDRSAPSFDNPDFVDVVIHSYRHRFGLVDGDPTYSADAARLEQLPEIAVPAILLQGDKDGVDPRQTIDSTRFRRFVRSAIVGGGHNLIQENPVAIAAAVAELSRG
jgi:pimeloyl-ACP methyl ester carboxylesterase